MERLKFNADDLRAFLRVADCSSLSEAAARFDVPKSSLSRAIARLEASIGSPLFDRRPAGLVLTEAGAQLLPHAQMVADAVSATEDAMRASGGALQGTLRVDVPHLFANRVLARHIPQFLAENPLINLVVDISPKAGGAHAPDADVTIRVGAIEDRALLARKIGVSYLRLCGSASAFSAEDADAMARLQTPNQAADICQFESVFERDATGVFRDRLVVVDPEVRHAMVLSGAGWAWLPAFLCQDDVAAGTLRDATVGRGAGPVDIHALYSPYARTSLKVLAFLKFLDKALAGTALQSRTGI